MSFDDLSVIEPDQLREMGGLTEEQSDKIVSFAEKESERLEAEQRKRRVVEKSQFTSPRPLTPVAEVVQIPAVEPDVAPEAQKEESSELPAEPDPSLSTVS